LVGHICKAPRDQPVSLFTLCFNLQGASKAENPLRAVRMTGNLGRMEIRFAVQ
jgi:hypothetical protein